MQGIKFTDEDKAEKKLAVISWLEASIHGAFTKACKASGISIQTGYEWMKEDPQFKIDVDKARAQALESGIDFAERHLLQAIRKGNVSANIFYLKSHAKGRGYDQKANIPGEPNDNATVNIVHDATASFRQLLTQLADIKSSGGKIPLTLDGTSTTRTGDADR